MSKRPLGIVLPAVMALALTAAFAVQVKGWSASTAAEFARGTLEGTALDEEGRLVLAPELETLWGPESGTVWQVRPAGDGGAFVALSSPGRVLRVKRGETPQAIFESEDEALVTALAADGAGGVYFGISPEGRILHADAAGEVRTLLQTPATFIWGLEVDGEGRLWAGTGLPGLVLRVTPEGKAAPVFHSGEDPVRCLSAVPGGGMLVGTGGRGRVIRIDSRGKPYVLYDADESEIVSVARDEAGRIFALAAESARQPRPASPNAELAQAIGNAMRVVVTPQGSDETAEQEAHPAPQPVQVRPGQGFTSRPGGAAYRLDPDGSVRKIWTASNELPFALALDGEGHVLIATGDKGQVILLEADGAAVRLLRIASEQASAMARAGDGAILIGGSTDARVERLGPRRRSGGTYFTPAIDGGTIADWGRLRWEADLPPGAKLSVEARSGNTDDPDNTWSDWVSLPSRDGAAGVDAGVPPARWFQMRIDLADKRGSRPRLRRLAVAYLPRNRAPRVQALSVEPAGVVIVRRPVPTAAFTGSVVTDDPISRQAANGQRGTMRPAPLRRGYEPGARTFQWQAEDPDGDRLRYRLDLRREGTTHWFPLVRESEDEFFSWDARGVPNGSYRVRLTAADSADNPRGGALSHEKISDLFVIDNSRPTVEGLDVKRAEKGLQVEFVARDPGGTVAAVEVALDGAAWQPLHPLDGVADSAEERYRLVVEPDPAATDGTRALLVRVTDAAGNLGGEMWLLERP